MRAKRERNQKILLKFMLGASMTEIHNSTNHISVTRVGRIIIQETYFLMKEKQIKGLSPLLIRDRYKDHIIGLLEHQLKLEAYEEMKS